MNLEIKIEKIMNENEEFILIIDDIKNNENYKEDLRKNLGLVINKEKNPVFFIDAKKYNKEILDYFDNKVNTYPFIIKVKNKEIVNSYNTIIKGL